MPQAATRHPSREQLAAFDQGRLGSEEFASVEAHIAGCASCCEMLEHVSNDPFVTRIRELADADTSVVDPGETPLPVDTGWPDGVAPMDSPVPPSLVDHPRYRITGELGRGGMGVVYRAEHKLMNRTVALKVINPHRLDNPAAVQRFKREVEAMAGLQHPNTVVANQPLRKTDDSC
jgi:serine/threonine-protein kinase